MLDGAEAKFRPKFSILFLNWTLLLCLFFLTSVGAWAQSYIAASLPRGLYKSPITVELHSQRSSNDYILYTLDGSIPNLTNLTTGQTKRIKSGQTLSIFTSTVVRAAIEGLHSLPFNTKSIETLSYIFPDTVFQQQVRFYNSGENLLPTNRLISDQIRIFEDDQDQIFSNQNIRASILRTFETMPVVSLSSASVHKDSESPASVEIFFPKDERSNGPSVQANAGLEFFGNSSLAFPKKNYKLSFSETRYGVDKLRIKNLFKPWGQFPVREEFNEILLRSAAHDSVIHWWNQLIGLYTRNEWAQKTMFELGHLGVHMRWTHVFLNGEYFGVFQMMERPSAEHVSEYMGLEKNELTALRTSCKRNVDSSGKPLAPSSPGNNIAAVPAQLGPGIGMQREDPFNTCYGNVLAYDGEYDDWRESVAAAYTGVNTRKRFNYSQFIDYMLLNLYSGNTDWLHNHNWAAVMSASQIDGESHYKYFPTYFFAWDNDFMFVRNRENVAPREGPSGPYQESPDAQGFIVSPFRALYLKDPEFRQAFIDRSFELLQSPSSPLSAEKSAQRFWDLTESIKDALPLEYSRWYAPESYHISNWQLPNAYSFFKKWLDERSRITGVNFSETDDNPSYIPNRNALVLNQIKSFYGTAGFPNFDPPKLRHARSVYPVGSILTFSNMLDQNKTIYFTTDGSDPRNPGGGINPLAHSPTQSGSILRVERSFTLSARILHIDPATKSSIWSALLRENVLSEGDLPRPPTPENFAINFIHYHPKKNPQEEYLGFKNVSMTPLELNGLVVESNSTDDPVYLRIDSPTILMPGKEILFARNVAMLKTVIGRNPTHPLSYSQLIFPKPYQGKLSNSGTTLTLSWNSTLLYSLTYADRGLWPRSADGDGDALYFSPTEIRDFRFYNNVYNNPANWIAAPVERTLTENEIPVDQQVSPLNHNTYLYSVKIPSYLKRHHEIWAQHSATLNNWLSSKTPNYFDTDADNQRHFLFNSPDSSGFYRLLINLN